MLSELKKGGDEVGAVVFGKGVEGLATALAAAGADKVFVADDDLFAAYNTGAYVAQIVAMIKEFSVRTNSPEGLVDGSPVRETR